MEFSKLNAATVVVCPARDAEAGVTSGSATYLAYPTMRGMMETARQGDFPELADGVRDGVKFVEVMDRAVQSYADWSARFVYMRKKANMFRETGFRLMPAHPYRVVMWVDVSDAGYVFYFLPVRDAGRISASAVTEGAHAVHVAGNAGEEG